MYPQSPSLIVSRIIAYYRNGTFIFNLISLYVSACERSRRYLNYMARPISNNGNIVLFKKSIIFCSWFIYVKYHDVLQDTFRYSCKRVLCPIKMFNAYRYRTLQKDHMLQCGVRTIIGINFRTNDLMIFTFIVWGIEKWSHIRLYKQHRNKSCKTE